MKKLRMLALNSIADEALDIIKPYVELNNKEYDIVWTGLEPIKTNIPVFCPCTGIEHIQAPLVTYLDDVWKKEEGANITSTAEHTWSLLLQTAKLKKIQLKDKKIGIIGYGRIGRRIALYADAFGMDSIIHDKRFVEEHDFDNLHFLLTNSDIITIHVPLNKNTENMIGAKELALMKREVILVNTSRGQVVDKDAIAKALYNPNMYYANDFFQLAGFSNVIATPHIGGNCKEARVATDVYIANKVVEYVRGL